MFAGGGGTATIGGNVRHVIQGCLKIVIGLFKCFDGFVVLKPHIHEMSYSLLLLLLLLFLFFVHCGSSPAASVGTVPFRDRCCIGCCRGGRCHGQRRIQRRIHTSKKSIFFWQTRVLLFQHVCIVRCCCCTGRCWSFNKRRRHKILLRVKQQHRIAARVLLFFSCIIVAAK